MPIFIKRLFHSTLAVGLLNAWLGNASSADVTENPELQDLHPSKQPVITENEKISEPSSEPAPQSLKEPITQPPAISLPAPPPLPERPPLPPPPEVALPAPLGSVQPQFPLSWRVKAYKLAKTQALPAGSAREIIYANLQDTFSALSAALKETGLVLKAQFPDAGHLFAQMNTNDGNSVSVIGALREPEPNRTEVMLLIEPKSFSSRTRLFDELFAKMRSLLERNKLL